MGQTLRHNLRALGRNETREFRSFDALDHTVSLRQRKNLDAGAVHNSENGPESVFVGVAIVPIEKVDVSYRYFFDIISDFFPIY